MYKKNKEMCELGYRYAEFFLSQCLLFRFLMKLFV